MYAYQGSCGSYWIECYTSVEAPRSIYSFWSIYAGSFRSRAGAEAAIEMLQKGFGL